MKSVILDTLEKYLQSCLLIMLENKVRSVSSARSEKKKMAVAIFRCFIRSSHRMLSAVSYKAMSEELAGNLSGTP